MAKQQNLRGRDKQGHIVAHDVCLHGRENGEIFVSERNQKHFVSWTQFLCPRQMLGAGANRETFVSATRLTCE